MIQICFGTAFITFKPFEKFHLSNNGLLTLETFSVRGQALFSDVDVPWDAGTLEYAWLVEICIEKLLGRLFPSQVFLQIDKIFFIMEFVFSLQIVILLQCIEALALLAACSDDELLLPEKFVLCISLLSWNSRYNFCIHMNDLHTCSRGALNLVDRKGQVQNCECEEKLKYKSLLVSIEQLDVAIMEQHSACELQLSSFRMAYCNFHSLSLCPNLLLKLPSANSHSFKISRCHFSEKSFMYEPNKSVLSNSLKSGRNVQPAICQSIIYDNKWMITMKKSKTNNSFAIQKEYQYEEILSEKKTYSDDSFHSTFSSIDINVCQHMVCPILASPILHESYVSFLSTYETNDDYCLPSEHNVTEGVKSNFFRKVTSGIDELNLAEQDIKKKSVFQRSENIKVPFDEDSPDEFTMIFVTPLFLEAVQRIAEQVSFTFMFIHPAFIVQHLYTLCTFRHHSQPLVEDGLSKLSCHKYLSQIKYLAYEKGQVRLHSKVTLPDINITFFQCGMIEKTIRSSSLEDSASHLARSSVVVLNFQKNDLLISSTDFDKKKNLPEIGLTLKGHAQFLQLVESWKLDFAYNKSLSPKYRTNWNELCSRFMGYDLRVVVDADFPGLVFKINSDEDQSEVKSVSLGALNQLAISVEPIDVAVGLCKPIEQTTSKEWPLFDVFAPCFTSWIYAVDRLSKSLAKNVAAVNERIDLILIKLLSEVLDHSNGQLFTFDKSCFADVQVYNKALGSCPSCLLTIILLRYAVQEDLNNYWQQADHVESRRYLDGKRRKQALIALLSHWQTIICSEVKISNVEMAHRFVEHTLKSTGSSHEVRITVDSNQLNSAVDNSTRPTAGSHQMDLYHWILAKHREHKEASTRSKVAKKLLDDAPVNAMEIDLSAFFWSFYEARGLQFSKASILLPTANINFKYIIKLITMKVDLLEPKMISASNINYLSTTKHHLLHLESVRIIGQVHTEPHFDDLNLRLVRITVCLSYNSYVQNIHAVFPFAAVCLFNDFSRVYRSCTSTLTHLKMARPGTTKKEMISVSKSLSQFTNSDSIAGSTCWLHNVLDKFHDYIRFKNSKIRINDDILELKVDGKTSIKVGVFEMTLTHLYISMTLKKTQLDHINQRSRTKSNTIIDEVNASVQRANLILSEFVIGRDAKHIVSFLVKSSSLKFERNRCSNGLLKNRINILVGDIEGDMPIHAQNLHEVVLRNVSQLNEQITRLEYSTPTPVGEYSAHLQRRQTVAVVNFELVVSSIELSAQLLPSLKVKYRLDQAESNGNTGSASRFTGRIRSHVVHFIVITPINEKRNSLDSDTFTLALPHISADGAYRMVGKSESFDRMATEDLQFREGGYIDLVLNIGKLEHVFTTDLLNQILFAEQCFRAELTSLIDRIIGDRTVRPPVSSDQQLLLQDPFLFTITACLRAETAPWLQLTATTPTSIAVRLTFDNITATITNRWTKKGSESKIKKLYGKAVIGVSAKLGLLVKTAMFEEIETELQEFATFMTQITVQNKNSSVSSAYSYVVTVNRPILLIKSSAIDKAILLWLNYKNTYDFWHEERKKMLTSERLLSLASSHVSSPLSVETEMNVNLSLKVTNGIYVCMPLYSADLSENLSALLISLQSTDITVCVKKELACQATFHKFKVKFIDNFDDQALNDNWIEDEAVDPSLSNYFYFPQGNYQLVSRATTTSDSTEKANWTLSVKWQMCGMVIDFDHRIGKLVCLLISTFSSFTSDINEEDWEESVNESSIVCEDRDEQDADIDATGELRSLSQSEERIQWLERKMHEQSVLVNDLVQCGASEPAIEKERRTLRKLESARFKQFRKSMLEKLKRNAIRQRKKLMEPRKVISIFLFKSFSNSMSDELHETKLETQLDAPSKISCVTSRKNLSFGLQFSGFRCMSSQSGLSQIPDKGQSNKLTAEGNLMTDTVNMNIDVQVSIESGLCTLRALSKQEETDLIAKRPSARDLKLKMAQTNETFVVSKLAIPSVDVRAYYTSVDITQIPKQLPRHVQAMFSHKCGRPNLWRRPAFYLTAELASMPQESLITPHLADFLEQMLETVPENNVSSSINISKMNMDERYDSDVPIVEIDTSAIPLDVLVHLTVQSSTIRFEGQQQRTAAADCLLKLPSLTLMASTRPVCENAENGNEDITGGGIHVAATLSAFSLNVYSPHQRSTAQDALLLTLDHLSVLVSRSKNNRFESDNKVQFVLTANVGSANFIYDMRRLAELISFPKPWYRRTIVHRLFFGGHSVKTPTPNANSLIVMNQASSKSVSHQIPSSQGNLKKKEWSAAVICGVEWKELNISAQMANTMGNTKLIVQQGDLRGYCQLNSKHDRAVSINFGLKSAALSANGGAISGEIVITILQISCTNQSAALKPPRNFAKLNLEEIQSRIEWMSRPIFIAKCDKPSVTFLDEWLSVFDDVGEVLKASVAVNITCSWSDLQLIITKVTVDDLMKIAQKLKSFFQEQLINSRMVWGIRSSVTEDQSLNNGDRCINFTKYHHWQSVLDMLTDIQARQKLLPMPKGSDGVTVVGGVLELSGQSLSLACMHGEMNASSWALFHMRQPTIIFEPEARYIFISDDREVGVLIAQRLNIRLGDMAYQRGDTECMAVVCRVQQSRGSMVRQMSSILACLHHFIGDVLVRLKYVSPNSDYPVAHHSVLQLFQFPALDAVLSTLQKQAVEVHEELKSPEVRSSFICEFHDSVNVQTDFSAQVSFLPELINTYMKIKTEEEKAVDVNRDFRHFVCERWMVDPKICFIDRFKWNPPVIDEILRKLQIFDHRTTIPKALQRGLLDPCDAFLSHIEFLILLIASKSSKNKPP
ncbi:unnamed protein product [Thelazia callipaeda]|uniref:FSA_C domain-containing protein n=1 Tax=Thelazia callipaeda TaxID=103827 RepID=A0A158RBH7_THECL|nr:unnamed protein product [Thelazia callipaeda]